MCSSLIYLILLVLDATLIDIKIISWLTFDLHLPTFLFNIPE